MKSHLYHLQVNIDYKNVSFYKKLMELIGWSEIFEMEGLIGYTSGNTGDVWFCDAEKKNQNDYDGPGMNHIAIRVDKLKDIDEVKEHLEKDDIKMLFDTPRHRPEFAASEKETYYQIMFESPDKVLFEIVYIGQK